MTSHDPEDQGRDPKNVLCVVSQNGWRYRLLCNGAPIIYGAWRVKWSRDRWRHVTQKDQGRDPIMFDAHYLENGWRYRLGCNGVGLPIGNGVWRVEWSGARCRRVCDKIAWKYRQEAKLPLG